MSQSYQPAEPSPDPFERFPLYTPPADPPPAPAAVPAASQALIPVPPRQVVLAAPSYGAALVPSDQQVPNTTVTVVAWVVAVVTGLYMLPWAIAATRGKANQWAIFAGNLLLGWTLVGWIVALVKSCGAHRPLYPVSYPALAAANPGWYPSPDGRGVRYWDGVRWTAHQ